MKATGAVYDMPSSYQKKQDDGGKKWKSNRVKLALISLEPSDVTLAQVTMQYITIKRGVDATGTPHKA